MAGAGIDRRTGRMLTGWPHVVQSIEVIFTTRIGSRVMRRSFGSMVPKLLGEPLTEATTLRFFTAMIAAIDLWEPRFKVRAIDAGGKSAEQLRGGRLGIGLRGEYRPRGHLGDPTPDPQERVIWIGQNGTVSA